MLTIILLSLFSAHSASARMGPGELGPNNPPCDLNQVNQCSEAERQGSLRSRADGEALQQQINTLAPLVETLRGERDQAEKRDDAVISTQLLLKDEISFLAEPPEHISQTIIPGFASAEDFFSLTAAERSWQDGYPADRARLLNAQLEGSDAEELERKNQLQEISTKFAALNGQYESVKAQQANLFAAADAHANMSNTGCEQRMCQR